MLWLGELFARWLEVTSALLQVAGPARLAPPTAMYYAACMVRAERNHSVSWTKIAAIIQHESQWRPHVVSRTNDYGLGQHHCPSFFCRKRPTVLERAFLLEPCANIQLTAEELARKRASCRRCKNYVRLYNPGNPRYSARIARWERRFRRAAHKSAQPQLAWTSPGGRAAPQ